MHLDTHVVTWLFEGRRDQLPRVVQRRLDTFPLVVSPIVELELAYLFEVGKVSGPPNIVFERLVPSLGLQFSEAPFRLVIHEAVTLTWARDPFDRIIAAQAIADRESLLTADRLILANLQHAIWDKPDI